MYFTLPNDVATKLNPSIFGDLASATAPHNSFLGLCFLSRPIQLHQHHAGMWLFPGFKTLNNYSGEPCFQAQIKVLREHQ